MVKLKHEKIKEEKEINNRVFIDLDKTSNQEIPPITPFQGLIDIKKNGRLIVKNSIFENIDTLTNDEVEYILTHFKQYISPIMTSSYIPTAEMMEVVRKVAPEFKVRFKTEKVGSDKIIPISPAEFFEGERIFQTILRGINPDWSEHQKYRYLYNQVGKMLSYDLNVLDYGEKASIHEKYSRNIFTSISKNWGICASFAEIYDYLCYRMGLDSTILSEDDHDYVLLTDSNGRDYLTDLTFDSARIKFGLKTENYAVSKEEFERNSHDLSSTDISGYEISQISESEIEELDKITGSLDDFGGEYTNSILENLANNLEGNNITEKAICFIKRVRDLKNVGRVTDSDYVQIIKWILSKCQDKDFSDKIDVTSFVCEDTIELPRKILLKISGEKFIQFDYKTKEYEVAVPKILEKGKTYEKEE